MTTFAFRAPRWLASAALALTALGLASCASAPDPLPPVELTYLEGCTPTPAPLVQADMIRSLRGALACLRLSSDFDQAVRQLEATFGARAVSASSEELVLYLEGFQAFPAYPSRFLDRSPAHMIIQLRAGDGEFVIQTLLYQINESSLGEEDVHRILGTWRPDLVYPVRLDMSGVVPIVRQGQKMMLEHDYDRFGHLESMRYYSALPPEPYENEPTALVTLAVEAGELPPQGAQRLQGLYPDQAWRMRREGDARVSCSIIAGQFSDCVVTHSPNDPAFGDAARRLLRAIILPADQYGGVIFTLKFRFEE